MANPVGLVLGNIPFYRREVPDTINFGGKQMLALHKNLGGYRTIDAMGPDPDDIHWSGHFLTVNGIPGTAVSRARAVDNLRKSGSQVWLYWGTFSFLVVVKHFSAIYKNEWEIAYKIAVQVVEDPQPQTALPTLTQQIQNDINALQAIGSASPAVPATTGSTTITTPMNAGITGINNAITVATNSGAVPLENLSLTQLQPVQDAVSNALDLFTAGSVAPAGINLDAVTGASTLDGINSFVTEVGNVAAESDVHTAIGYLGRISANLAMAPG